MLVFLIRRWTCPLENSGIELENFKFFIDKVLNFQLSVAGAFVEEISSGSSTNHYSQ
jgi:hypothetical protein